MQIAYAGYLPAGGLWLASPDASCKLSVHRLRPLCGYSSRPTSARHSHLSGKCRNVRRIYIRQFRHGAWRNRLTVRQSDRSARPLATAAFDAAGNISSQLSGIEVLAGGLPAPLLYAAPNQINLVVPFALAAGSTANFELRRSGSVVASFPTNVVSQHLGLFTLDSTGTGQLAALNQDGSVNSAANPAQPGTAVAIFATGLGAMTPLPVDGSRPSQAGTSRWPTIRHS